MNNTTKDIDEQIVSLRKSGMSIREVSEELSVTYDKVRYVLDKAGLQNHKYKRVCVQCNDDYKTLSHQSKFCSVSCKNKYNRNRVSEKNKQYCEQCEKVFYKYKQQKYCSKSCQEEYWSTLERKKPVYISKAKKIKRCINCSVEYKTFSSSSKLCGYSCRLDYKRKQRPIHNFKCKECSEWFKSTNRRRVFCSKDCGDKYSWRKSETQRRKRLKQNGKIEWDISIERLMKRDKSTCHICGNKVNIKLDTNDDYYPSIDHVIPVSKGGTHTWDNVKLAHRICNSLKSDTVVDNPPHKIIFG